ncbi:LexA family transcriptional regulator [Lonepinella sp. BR2271]|uniref:LexA family transcriptional regulator n=1 Tax=Lonepinella sp. BR2271 TaxID=3434550 RepID=UPI003F6DB4CA
MKTLAERLRYLLNINGLTEDEFAKKVNVSQQAINYVLNGKTREPKKIYEMANALDVDVEWLKTGQGNYEPEPISPVSSEPDENHTYRIDQLDVRAAANLDGMINPDFPDIIRSIWFSDDGVRKMLNRHNTQGISIIQVPTDSMVPTIYPKDLVFIDTRIKTFSTDGIYVFLLNDRLYIKRLQMLPTGVIQATSDNKNYQPFEITEELFDTALIVGKFIQVMSIDMRDL